MKIVSMGFLAALTLGTTFAQTAPVSGAAPAVPAATPGTPQEAYAQGLVAFNANDFPTAFRLWKTAAERGLPIAMANLGRLYQDGTGVTADQKVARDWYRKAADAGLWSGMYRMGLSDRDGVGGPQNLAQAGSWLAKAKTMSGLSPDQLKLIDDALASLQGDTAASTFTLGFGAYRTTQFPEAMTWWKKSAELGEPSAMFNLGIMFEQGKGTEVDLPAALEWMQKAEATGKKPDATKAIARLKEKSLGLEELKKGTAEYDAKNYPAAVSWYEKAAEKGNVNAMALLGSMYQFPIGPIEKDRVKARAWYQKAADKGDAVAKFSLEQLDASAGMDAFLDSYNPKNDVKSSGSSLVKGSRWTADQILAALKAGSNHTDLAIALNTDGTEYYVGDYYRILTAPESAKVISHGKLSMALAGGYRQGAGPWTRELAREAIEQRRKQISPAAAAQETPELRAKAQGGDPAASLSLYYLLTKKHGAKEWPKDEIASTQLRTNASNGNHAAGLWILGEALSYKPEAEKDPLLVADYYRRSAEAGDPMGAYKLAGLFASDDKGVRQNFAEVEYWLIEAAARAPEGFFSESYNNVEFDLSMLYSMHAPNGHLPMAMRAYQPASLRWARELSRRGGQFTDFVRVTLDYLEQTDNGSNQKEKNVRTLQAAIAPEVAPFSRDELSKLEASAQRGDVAAWVKLGDAYATGRGLRQHDARAVEFYLKAAEKNSARAARVLADNCARGYAMKKDPAQRLAWLKKAGEAGDAAAWREFADFQHYNYSSEGMVTNYPVALDAYEKAIAGGDARALNNLGLLHRYGRGVPKNEAKAEELIAKSAHAGYNHAQLDYAQGLAKKNDFKTAAGWFQKANDGGLSEARHGLASSLAKSGDIQGAKRWLLELAEETSTDAQSELAKLLEATGDLAGALKWYRALSINPMAYDFIQKDAANAAKRIEEELNPKPGSIAALRKQAEAGDVNAMLQLVQKLAPTDKPAALVWLRKAADKGNAQAMLTLGLETAATDKPAGLTLMQQAADGGSVEAKFRIGMMLFRGQEMPQDQTRGLALATEAANGGFAPAQFELGRAMVAGAPGIPANATAGTAYLEKAAAQRMPQALGVLGEIYERGVGLIPANPAKALKYYQDAQKLGLQQVAPAIQRLQLQLSGKAKAPVPATTGKP